MYSGCLYIHNSDKLTYMHVQLTDLRTAAELYKTGVLQQVNDPLYPSTKSLHQISLFQGDICELELDSIVNAAQKRLLGGGGVDGAIHIAAGPDLLKECRTLNGCSTGDAKITGGYNLPSRHVIHTVGPVYRSGDVETKAKQLASCYKTSLNLAVENSLKHIAFPSISTGAYGYPIEDATHIALREVRHFCDSENGDKLDRIVFVVWSDKDKNVYEQLMPQYFPPVKEEVATELSVEVPVTA